MNKYIFILFIFVCSTIYGHETVNYNEVFTIGGCTYKWSKLGEDFEGKAKLVVDKGYFRYKIAEELSYQVQLDWTPLIYLTSPEPMILYKGFCFEKKKDIGG